MERGKNSVDIATVSLGADEPDAVLQVSGGPVNEDDLRVTAADGSEVKPEIVNGLVQYPGKPEYGVTHGAFTEIDPATVDTSAEPTKIMLRDTRIQSDRTGFPTMMYNLPPAGGQYIVYQVKNNGTEEQVVAVARQATIAAYAQEPFTKVSLAPGATLTRAFSISEDSSRLECNLVFDVTPVDLGGAGTDVTISLWQYD